ncbi:MAG TPA: FxsB family cyclophane-forming radical SAM/SPASM peptide maturase [Kineosporiaceae bacterium]
MAEPAIRQFVLKVHSRCNLACDYCYVYESVDQSWRTQPRSIAVETVRATGRRIAEHSERHGLPRVWVTLHGGEPLMIGRQGVRAVVDELRASVAGATELEIGLQTNGVLLDERMARYLLLERVRVGISLDGGRVANDRHRLFHHGGSSYDRVVDAVRLMTSPTFRPVFAGILATVDVANDPVELFHELTALDPGRIDLLLPHATWETPPPSWVPGRTVYGDWLVAFFDTWYDAPPTMGVRLFQEIMHALLGGASTSEAVGLSAPESIVVETDGSFERSDILKVTYPGAPTTGYNVFEHSLEDVLHHPAIRSAAQGRSALCASCRSCPIVVACGGGLYPHRYRADNGFDNPSVYCHDLGRLINRIGERIAADLARRGISLDPALSSGAPAGSARSDVEAVRPPAAPVV